MLNFLYSAIAQIVLAIHSGLAPIFGADSGAAWALSIVLLTVAMRLLLFPLFVKQIRAQRAMQALQPKVKALREKYKNDKESQQREMMALYKEHNANPVASCLPLILQLPVFFALFRVLEHIKPGAKAAYGFSTAQIESAAHAKIFGAPIAASFNSSADVLKSLGTTALNVQVLAAVMIVLMGASTFLTQRQMLSRPGTAPLDPMQARTQKIMLYVLPFTFVIFGYRFPIGVLLYWLTTNVWSMGQQFFVIRKMPVAIGGQAGAPAPSTGKAAAPAKQSLFARMLAAAAAQQETQPRGRKASTAAGKRPPSPAPASPPARSTAGDNPPARSTAGDNPPARSTAGDNPPAADPAAGPAAATDRTQASPARPGKPAVAAVGARRPNTSRAKRKGRRGGRH